MQPPGTILSDQVETTEDAPAQNHPTCSKNDYDIVNRSMSEMVKLLEGLHKGEWPNEAKRLRDSKPSSRTIAVVGKSGDGKLEYCNE